MAQETVERCMNGQCVKHPVNCSCDFCVEYESQSYVVTEQGMFGDLLDEYKLDTNHSEKNTK